MQEGYFAWRRMRRRRALHISRRVRWTLAKDLLIELFALRLRLDAELTLENADTDLVLAEGRRPPAQLDVEPHHRAMGRLLQGVEGEEPQPRLQRRLHRARGALVLEQLRQRLERDLAQTLALREEPLLERRLVKGEAFQELAAVEGGGTL